MSPTRRRWALNALLLVAVLGAGAAGVWLASHPSAAASSGAAVRTVTVTTGSVTATVSADGSVEPVREVAVNPGTSGTVTSIRVAVGARVVKGQVLATLARADARQALRVARASLAAAEASLDSAQASLAAAEAGTTTTDPATGQSATTVSDTQVAQAQAQVGQARIQVLQARATVADAKDALAATTVRSPTRGTVLQVNGLVGSSVTAGSTGSTGTPTATGSAGSTSDLFVIADLTRLQAAVSFSEADVAVLEVGQPATVSFPALADVTANGKITSIAPTATVSNNVVTYDAVVRLTTAPRQVRIGQSASVTVTTGRADGVLVVPSVAVTSTGSRRTVTVLADGQQRVVAVEVGVEGAALAQIRSGLAAGDQVVLDTTTSDSTGSGFPGGGLPGVVPGGAPPAGGPPAGPGGAGGGGSASPTSRATRVRRPAARPRPGAPRRCSTCAMCTRRTAPARRPCTPCAG